MTPKEYKKLALKTDIKGKYQDVCIDVLKKTITQGMFDRMRLMHGAMGMCGEAGEVMDEIKKIVIYEKDINDTKLLSECGDVLWYMTILLDELGYSLEDAMKANIEKLQKRYPCGFTKEDALKNRDNK